MIKFLQFIKYEYGELRFCQLNVDIVGSKYSMLHTGFKMVYEI